MGRVKEYRNAADKQKAYRERQKQRLDPYGALRKKLFEAEQVVLETTRAHDKFRMSLAPLDDAEYRKWLAESQRLVDDWWKAHCAWLDILRQIPDQYR